MLHVAKTVHRAFAFFRRNALLDVYTVQTRCLGKADSPPRSQKATAKAKPSPVSLPVHGFGVVYRVLELYIGVSNVYIGVVDLYIGVCVFCFPSVHLLEVPQNKLH